jgi:hypothetical protein
VTTSPSGSGKDARGRAHRSGASPVPCCNCGPAPACRWPSRRRGHLGSSALCTHPDPLSPAAGRGCRSCWVRSRCEKNSPGGSHRSLVMASCQHRSVYEETKTGPGCTNRKYLRVQLPLVRSFTFHIAVSWLPRIILHFLGFLALGIPRPITCPAERFGLTALATASGPESRIRQPGWSQPAGLRYVPPAQHRPE